VDGLRGLNRCGREQGDCSSTMDLLTVGYVRPPTTKPPMPLFTPPPLPSQSTTPSFPPHLPHLPHLTILPVPRSCLRSSARASFSDPAHSWRRTCAPIPSVRSLRRTSTHGCKKKGSIPSFTFTRLRATHLCPSCFGYPCADSSDDALRFRFPCPRSSPSCEGRTHSSS
jgi:hypothetical protein